MKSPFLFIALDGLTEGQALKRASELSKVEGNFGFKINLDYLLHSQKGLEVTVGNIQQYEQPIFADLKMWNGTRTMTEVIKNLVALKVNYLNVYALADDLLPKAIKMTEGSNTKVLALTVLSHYTEAYCQKHFRRSLGEAVRHFAEVALEAGCHGIILPGTTLEIVQDLETIKVVPGIRPKWYTDARHKQAIEPRTAVEKGADILVCGSPILKSPNCIEALKKVLSEMQV